MSDREMLNELGISVATASPTLRERQSALAVVVGIMVGFGALVPFANTQLPRLDSFIPTVEAIIAVTQYCHCSSIVWSIPVCSITCTLGARGWLFFLPH